MSFNRRDFIRLAGASAASLSLRPALAAESPALTDDTLTIGSSLAMTGPLGGFGTAAVVGIEAAFAEANQAGGIHGRKVLFKPVDDGYVAERTAENLRAMLGKDQALAFISCVGTPNNLAGLPLLEAAGVPSVGPMTGANSLRRPDWKHVFHVRASYSDEARRLVEQLVSMGLKSIAVVHTDNAFGKEIAKDANDAIQAAGLTLSMSSALAVDGSNVDGVVNTVLVAKPTVVLLGTAGASSLALIQKLRAAAPGLPLAGTSVAFTQADVLKLGKAGQGMTATRVVPLAKTASSKIVREYQDALRANGVTEFGQGALESYINARVLLAGLRRAGRGVTRAKLRDELANLGRLDLGGFVVNYTGSAPNVGSRYVDLGIFGANGAYF